jgi:hypothetical protein
MLNKEDWNIIKAMSQQPHYMLMTSQKIMENENGFINQFLK